MNNLRAAAEMALEALEDASGRLSLEFTGHLVYRDEISDLRTALAQPEQTHPDHFAEVYIRVGDLHVKKVMTSVEFLQAYDPIKLLSLVANSCVHNIKDRL